MVPLMGKATSAAAAATGAAALTLADTEKEKPPAGLLNVVVVNPDYNKVCWGVYKAHCGPMRKVVEDYMVTNSLPPQPLRRKSRQLPIVSHQRYVQRAMRKGGHTRSAHRRPKTPHR